MAIQLNSPVTRDPLTHQGVTHFEVHVPHKRNQTGDAAVIDRAKVYIHYTVTHWDASGKVLSRSSRKVPATSWPAGFTADMRSIYNLIEQDARNNGLIGSGTEEPL